MGLTPDDNTQAAYEREQQRNELLAQQRQHAQNAADQQNQHGLAGEAAAQARNAPQMDMGGADAAYAQSQQARQGQQGLVGMLQGAAEGKGTSVAQAQMNQGQAQAAQNGMAQAAGAKGLGGVLAQRAAVQSSEAGGQQAAMQGATLRAQEIAQARGQLGDALGQQRQQDQSGMAAQMSQQGMLAQNQLAQQAQNDAMSQAYMQQQQGALGADTTIAGQANSATNASAGAANQEVANYNEKRKEEWGEKKDIFSTVASGAGSLLGGIFSSDPDLKENIKPEGSHLGDYFAGLADGGGSTKAADMPDAKTAKEVVGDGGGSTKAADMPDAKTAKEVVGGDRGVGKHASWNVGSMLGDVFKSVGGKGGASPEHAPLLDWFSKNDVSSDPKTKRDIAKDDGGDLADMLRKAPPFSFDYKDPEVDGEGRRYGVMTPDLKRSKPGAEMVRSTERGEMIDGKAAMSTTLAQLSNLQKQIDDLTGVLGTIKGGKRGAK